MRVATNFYGISLSMNKTFSLKSMFGVMVFVSILCAVGWWDWNYNTDVSSIGNFSCPPGTVTNLYPTPKGKGWQKGCDCNTDHSSIRPYDWALTCRECGQKWDLIDAEDAERKLLSEAGFDSEEISKILADDP